MSSKYTQEKATFRLLASGPTLYLRKVPNPTPTFDTEGGLLELDLQQHIFRQKVEQWLQIYRVLNIITAVT